MVKFKKFTTLFTARYLCRMANFNDCQPTEYNAALWLPNTKCASSNLYYLKRNVCVFYIKYNFNRAKQNLNLVELNSMLECLD